MSALFSSALGNGYRFACIVKNTGDIVFFNRPFQAFFPAHATQRSRTLSSLFELYQVPNEHQAALTAQMNENTPAALATSIQGPAQNEPTAVTFYLEPIERPTGFFLLRGQ
jgi:hypothetical protein